jgi:hypothetical protein
LAYLLYPTRLLCYVQMSKNAARLYKAPARSKRVDVVSLKQPKAQAVGLTGLEPVTLRLSSACSNQLSYRPLRL